MAVLHAQIDVTASNGSVTSLRKHFFEGRVKRRGERGAGDFWFDIDNTNGRYSGTFVVGDRVDFFLDGNNPPTTKVFAGTIESQDFESRENREFLVLRGRDYTKRLSDVTATEVYNTKTAAYIITDLGGKYFTENKLLNDFETAAKAGSFIAIGSPTTDAVPVAIGSVDSAGSNVAMERTFASNFKMQTGSTTATLGRWQDTGTSWTLDAYSGGKVGFWFYVPDDAQVSGLRYGIGSNSASFSWKDFNTSITTGFNYALFDFASGAGATTSGAWNWSFVNYQMIEIHQKTGASGAVNTWVDDLRVFKPNSVTYSNVTTGASIDHVTLKRMPVFDAVEEFIAEPQDMDFFVDQNLELNLKAKANSASTGITLNSGNVIKAGFDVNDNELRNKIWVYGGRYLTGWSESFTANGGSIFSLAFNPHNTVVKDAGTIKKGGIWEVNTSSVASGVNYLVDFDQKQIIFVSGTDNGLVPASGNTVSVDYEISVPVVKVAQDRDSINRYGVREKVIVDNQINDPVQAKALANAQISVYKNPSSEGRLSLLIGSSFNPSDTVNVNLPLQNVSNQSYQISEVIYDVNPATLRESSVVTLVVSKHNPSAVDVLRTFYKDIYKLKARDIDTSDVVTQLLDVPGGSLSLVEKNILVLSRSLGSSFLLGDTDLGRLGTVTGTQPYLGDSRGANTRVRIENFNNLYDENFFSTRFSGTVTTATWAGNGSLVINSGGQVTSTAVYLGSTTTISSATLSATYTGSLQFALQTSNGGYNNVSTGTLYSFGTAGSSLFWRATDISGVAARIDNLKISYNKV